MQGGEGEGDVAWVVATIKGKWFLFYKCAKWAEKCA